MRITKRYIVIAVAIIVFNLNNIILYAAIDSSIEVPKNLKTTATNNSIILEWDKVKNADAYEIDINGQVIDNGKLNIYVHSNLKPGNSYHFKVRTKKDANTSEWSSKISQVTANPINKTIENWNTKKELNLSRHGVGVVTINDLIYAVGGYGNDFCNTIEEYNPATNSWRIVTRIPTVRYSPAVVSDNENIYLIGGHDKEKGSLNTVDVYNISRDKWSTIATKPTAVSHFSAVLVDNKIYTFGGYSSNKGILNIVEVYDIARKIWTKKTDMPTLRSRTSAVNVKGQVYVLGGYNGTALGNIEVYDIQNDTWTKNGHMPIPRYGISLIKLYDKIYILGGYNTTAFNFIEEYDTTTNTFTMQKVMRNERFDFGAVIIKNLLYVVGGTNDAYPLDSVEQASFIKPDPPKGFNITPEENDVILRWQRQEDYMKSQVEVNGEIIDTDLVNWYKHTDIQKNFQHTYRARHLYYSTSKWTPIESYILWEKDEPGICIAMEEWYTYRDWIESDDKDLKTEIKIKANNMEKLYTYYINIKYNANSIDIDESSIQSPVLNGKQNIYINYENDKVNGVLKLVISQTGEIPGIDGLFDIASLKIKYKSFIPSEFIATEVQIVDEIGDFIEVNEPKINDVRLLEE